MQTAVIRAVYSAVYTAVYEPVHGPVNLAMHRPVIRAASGTPRPVDRFQVSVTSPLTLIQT